MADDRPQREDQGPDEDLELEETQAMQPVADSTSSDRADADVAGADDAVGAGDADVAGGAEGADAAEDDADGTADDAEQDDWEDLGATQGMEAVPDDATAARDDAPAPRDDAGAPGDKATAPRDHAPAPRDHAPELPDDSTRLIPPIFPENPSGGSPMTGPGTTSSAVGTGGVVAIDPAHGTPTPATGIATPGAQTHHRGASASAPSPVSSSEASTGPRAPVSSSAASTGAPAPPPPRGRGPVGGRYAADRAAAPTVGGDRASRGGSGGGRSALTVLGCLLLAAVVLAALFFLGRAWLSEPDGYTRDPDSTATTEPADEDAAGEEDATEEPAEDASPAPDDAQDLSAFQAPSGNIFCALDGDTVGCTMQERALAAQGRPDCPSGEAFAVRIGTEDSPQLTCGEVYADGGAETLSYGESATSGNVACESDSGGITCWNVRTGHGFTLARQTYDTF